MGELRSQPIVPVTIQLAKECIAKTASQRGDQWLAELMSLARDETAETVSFDPEELATFKQRWLYVPVQPSKPCCQESPLTGL